MAGETAFVKRLIERIEKAFPGSAVYKFADSRNLGVPDIMAIIPPNGRLIAAEVKQVGKLYEPRGLFEIDENKGLLKHTFSGPQISDLKRLKRTGADVCGIVRTHENMAWRLDPSSIPVHGQVTPRLLFSHGVNFTNDDDWKFWNEARR